MPLTADIFQAAVDHQLVLQRPDAESNKAGSGMQGYWRKPDGTVIFGSYTTNGLKTFAMKQFTMLVGYGEFSTAFDAARRWDPMTDPYRQLLERGGIKEFSREQIVELGWHRTPHAALRRAMQSLMATGASEAEALLMVMPQLQGYERTDIPCKLCHGRVFNSEDELQRHEVLHREDVQTRRLADSITAAMRGSSESNAPILQMLAEAIQQIAVGLAEQRTATTNIQALLAKSQAPAPIPGPDPAPTKSK